MSANLYSVFQRRFPQDLDQPFIRHRDGTCVSYANVDEMSGRIAALLVTLGVQPGDRVAAQVEKSATALLLYLGCLRAGAVYLPLNTAYTGQELEYFLKDAAPRVFVVDPKNRARLADQTRNSGVSHGLTLNADGQGTLTEQALAHDPSFKTLPRTDDDLAALLYSSGTTGQPKGVMLSHGALTTNAAALSKAWQFGSQDVLLHALPIFHTHGLFVATNTVLMNGARMIFHDQFAPEDVIKDLPLASVFMGVPTYYTRLLRDAALTAETCRSTRLFISGSAPLLDETFTAFKDRTGHVIVERYGMTEAGIITSANPDKPRAAGTVGFPLDGVTLRIADDTDHAVTEGETGGVQIRSQGLFSGYWNKADKTAEDMTPDGFFRTGDVGKLEPDGQLTLAGRAKDMFISGGFNVYPKEIEQVIDAMDGVEESAVVGLPHPDFGEAGLALVVADSQGPVDTTALRSSLKNSLANYKVPKLIVAVDALPRNAMGKVQKNLLRDGYMPAWTAALMESAD